MINIVLTSLLSVYTRACAHTKKKRKDRGWKKVWEYYWSNNDDITNKNIIVTFINQCIKILEMRSVPDACDCARDRAAQVP